MKKHFIFFASIAIFSSILFASCTKEAPVFTDGGSSGIIELDLPARTTSTVYAFAVKTFNIQSEIDFPVTVNYTGAAGAPNDVKVTLALDPDALSKYNLASSRSFESLTAYPQLFTVPSFTVTIPKGQKKAVFIIKLKTSDFDLNKSYAVGVAIKSVSEGILSGNYSTGIFQLVAKKQI